MTLSAIGRSGYTRTSVSCGQLRLRRPELSGLTKPSRTIPGSLSGSRIPSLAVSMSWDWRQHFMIIMRTFVFIENFALLCKNITFNWTEFWFYDHFTILDIFSEWKLSSNALSQNVVNFPIRNRLRKIYLCRTISETGN
jgi:hypothetical protein